MGSSNLFQGLGRLEEGRDVREVREVRGGKRRWIDTQSHSKGSKQESLLGMRIISNLTWALANIDQILVDFPDSAFNHCQSPVRRPVSQRSSGLKWRFSIRPHPRPRSCMAHVEPNRSQLQPLSKQRAIFSIAPGLLGGFHYFRAPSSRPLSGDDREDLVISSQ